jgi:hypothetical protein
LLLNVYFHHRMNFPCSVVGLSFSPVFRLIFKRMPDVEKCFANDSDDWRICGVQVLGRASVKRKSCTRPTENCLANFTSLRLCRNLRDNNARLVTTRIP